MEIMFNDAEKDIQNAMRFIHRRLQKEFEGRTNIIRISNESKFYIVYKVTCEVKVKTVRLDVDYCHYFDKEEGDYIPSYTISRQYADGTYGYFDPIRSDNLEAVADRIIKILKVVAV